MTQLRTNTMRYGWDTFTLDKSGCIIPKQPLDCTAADEINGFILEKILPVGSDIRVAFRVDGIVTKITGEILSNLPTQAYTADSILTEGNTIVELEALSSIPAFVGKQIYPIIAMISPSGTEVLPSLKLSLRTKSNQDQYTKTEESGEYQLSNSSEAQIYDISLSVSVAEGGSVVVEASLYQSGTWSEWVPLMSAKGQNAQKIKFKATYTVTTLGVSSAKISSLYVYTKSNSSVILGSNADIITKTQDFGTEMMYARLLIKHQHLVDARLKAYISFTETTFKRENFVIGSGTGAVQTLTLPDENIDFTSLQLFQNKLPIFDFDFNSQLKSVTFTAEKDSTIFATYTYGVEKEAWQEMQFGSTQPYSNGNCDSSDYTFSAIGTAKGVSAIRICLIKPDGNKVDELIGTGTGKQQLIVLSHYANLESIQLKAGNSTIPKQNWSYEQATKILTVIAPKDSPIYATYTYSAETPVVKGFVCAWNE